MIAQIIVNITAKRLQKTFTYSVPPALAETVRPGCRVLIPFGRRREEGIVIRTADDTERTGDFELKPVEAVLSVQAGAQAEIIETALWISTYYLCSLADALRLFLVEKKGISWDYRLFKGHEDGWESPEEKKILSYLDTHPGTSEKIMYKLFGPLPVEELVKRGAIRKLEILRNKVAPKTEKWLRFKRPDDGTLMRKKRQAELLLLLQGKECLSLRAVLAAGFSRDTVRNLITAGFLAVEEREKETDYLSLAVGTDKTWRLMNEQEEAIRRVQEDRDGRTWVLHGITGSGKTEVYMQLAREVIASAKQVLLLVPEIALTGQIVRRFTARFGEDVVVMHSKLSKGERINNRRRMANGESHICIGARSAVFTPLADLGLLIVDEAHDSSYKQDESPRYHAVAVARKRAAYYGCPVVLGSATPAISDYHKALTGEYGLLELKRRVLDRPLPEIDVVDMRDELARGNYNILSAKLCDLLRETLRQKKQAIVLLNRRGFSTFVMCRKCGYVVKCDTCDVPMVYHKDSEHLRCHYCESVKDAPAFCPACRSKYIKFFGAGTEKAEAQLRQTFPSARVIRLDQDTAMRKNSGDAIIEAFRRHDYDILLGTQMVAKGHDFPEVSAVGILAADSLLNMPAYWAGERTFQLLTQAAGRTGRGTAPGKVVMQTYAPDHYVIRHSKNQDYKGFYEEEITYRRELAYPPFAQLVKIVLIDEDENALWEKGRRLYDELRRYKDIRLDPVPEIIGPYVDIIKKIRNKYRIVILLRGPDLTGIKAYMRDNAAFFERGVLIDVDPAF